MSKLIDIRNSQGKLVCRIDQPSKTIEIAIKCCVTTIRFTDDGKVNIENTQKTA